MKESHNDIFPKGTRVWLSPAALCMRSLGIYFALQLSAASACWIEPDPNGHVQVSADVRSIPPWAFSDCSALKTITVPASVASIGDHAFSRAASLMGVTLTDGDGNGLVIGNNAFEYCPSLVSVDLPLRTASIGNDAAFFHCASLRALVIPDGVSADGTLASLCEGCSSLASVTLPERTTTAIPHSAFLGCSSLETATLPNNALTMGLAAFELCCTSLRPAVDRHSGKRACDRKLRVIRLRLARAPTCPSRLRPRADGARARLRPIANRPAL